MYKNFNITDKLKKVQLEFVITIISTQRFLFVEKIILNCLLCIHSVFFFFCHNIIPLAALPRYI